MEPHCHICYSTKVEDCVCDRCEQHYCYDCSYTFSPHYQHQGSRCYPCANQSRREKLDKSIIRENKLKTILSP